MFFNYCNLVFLVLVYLIFAVSVVVLLQMIVLKWPVMCREGHIELTI